MKMLPNGRMPERATNTAGEVHRMDAKHLMHRENIKVDEDEDDKDEVDVEKGDWAYGMGLGNLLTRQGKLLLPFQCRPNTVPKMLRGNETNAHNKKILSMVKKGIADVVP